MLPFFFSLAPSQLCWSLCPTMRSSISSCKATLQKPLVFFLLPRLASMIQFHKNLTRKYSNGGIWFWHTMLRLWLLNNLASWSKTALTFSILAHMSFEWSHSSLIMVPREANYDTFSIGVWLIIRSHLPLVFLLITMNFVLLMLISKPYWLLMSHISQYHLRTECW